jgi:hypothetical protein
MTDFYALWEASNRSLNELDEAHSYTVGDDETTPTFPRLEKFQAAEPIRNKNFSGPLDNRTHDAGEPDKWKEWNKVYRRALLGGKRVARTGRGYTVFPACPDVNAAILGCANKFLPSKMDEAGLPCEEFRDLCAHLAAHGVEKTAEGGYHWAFIEKLAAAYLRKQSSLASFTENQLRNSKPSKG